VLLATTPLAADAQEPGKVSRVGFLGPRNRADAAPFLDAFLLGLREIARPDGNVTGLSFSVAMATGPAMTAGGLMAYGPNLSGLHRRAAIYIDKILKGSKLGDLPIEQPTTYAFVVNIQTAKAIGLSIPKTS
jgi:hypothetical protein